MPRRHDKLACTCLLKCDSLLPLVKRVNPDDRYTLTLFCLCSVLLGLLILQLIEPLFVVLRLFLAIFIIVTRFVRCVLA